MMPSHQISTIDQTLPRLGPGSTGADYYRDLLVGLLILAAPFLLFPHGYGLLALLILPGIWLIRRKLVGRLMPGTPLDWPVLLLMVMILLSIWTTFDLSFSIGKISGLLFGIMIYYAVVDLARTSVSLQVSLAVFMIIGVGIALLAILGTRWVDKFPLLQPVIDRLPEALRNVRDAEEGFNPNQVGGVLIFFVPLQVMLWIYRQRNAFRRTSGEPAAPQNRNIKNGLGLIFTAISLGITGSVLLLSQSRGSLGGLVVGLLAIAAISTRWGKLAVFAGLIVLTGVLYSGSAAKLVGSGLETETAGTITLAGRVTIWSQAIRALADFPLGMGMNTFRHVMPLLYPVPSIPPDRDIAHAHNHLLQAGLDLGIPGLVAYLALWLGAGELLIRVIRETDSDLYRTIALGLFGSLIAHFTYGLTDAVALGAKPGFVFWWLLGLAVATHRCWRDRSISMEITDA